MQFDPISPQWRSNTSTDKITDMASALQSLRFIIGEIDPSKAIIGFNTSARSYTQGSPTGTGEHSIMIDPTPAIQNETGRIACDEYVEHPARGITDCSGQARAVHRAAFFQPGCENDDCRGDSLRRHSARRARYWFRFCQRY